MTLLIQTNGATESYHGNMKAVLKASRNKLLKQKVDWLIDVLTGDVVNQYDLMTFKNKYKFVSNKNKRALALTTIVQARGIWDCYKATLPTS